MRNCPICESENKTKLLSVKFAFDDSFVLPSQNDIVCCNDCGFVYADNEANQKNYDDYYKYYNVYADADNAKKTDNRFYYAEFFWDILKDRVNKTDSFIDVGCGDGGLLQVMRKNGVTDLFGLDPSEASINQLKKMNIDGMCGNIFNASEYDLSKFDVVISTGVAEHIFDLDGYISNLLRLVKEDGTIFIFVPAIEGFGRFYMNLPNYFNHEHINYFSLKSLDNLMRKFDYYEVSKENRLIKDPNGEYVIYGFYKKMKKDESNSVSYDSISRDSVLEYLKEYNIRKKKTDEILSSLNDDKYILWGVGSLALQLLDEESFKEKIVFAVDNNSLKQNTVFSGINIFSPETIKDSKYQFTILICSMQGSSEIVKQISEMGLPNKYVIIG